MKRDLSTALWLRPAEVTAAYGISRQTISDMARDGRLDSRKIKGKSGRKGMLFIRKSAMDSLMEASA